MKQEIKNYKNRQRFISKDLVTWKVKLKNQIG